MLTRIDYESNGDGENLTGWKYACGIMAFNWLGATMKDYSDGVWNFRWNEW